MRSDYMMLPGARLYVGPHGKLEESLGACCEGCAQGKGCGGAQATSGFLSSLFGRSSRRPARRIISTRRRAMGAVPAFSVSLTPADQWAPLTTYETAQGLTPSQQAAAAAAASSTSNVMPILLLGAVAVGGVLLWKRMRKPKDK